MHRRIALAGGGDAQDSRLIDEVFASWLQPNGKVLYLPIALRGIRSFDECLKWIRATFLPFNITNIEMWSNLAEHQGEELFEFAAVYIGGGNTYALLAEFLQSEFDQYLATYASRGGVIYGGSAGAVILGKDIQTIRHVDHNNVGLAATNALNLADDHALWVHYRLEDDELIYQYQSEYHQSVVALSERAGVILDNLGMHSIGFDSAYQFDEHGKHRIENL